MKIPPQNQTNDLPHFYQADSAVVSSKPFLSKVHKFFTGRFVVQLFFKIGDSTIYGKKSWLFLNMLMKQEPLFDMFSVDISQTH